MRASELAELVAVSLSSAALCTPFLVRAAFGEAIAPELALVLFAAYLTGYFYASLKAALAAFLASYSAASAAVILLVEGPVGEFMGPLAGNLALLVVSRNVALPSLVAAVPLSFVFAVLGAYRGEVARRRKRY